MFSKIKAKAAALFDRVVEKVTGNVPAVDPGIDLSKQAHQEAKLQEVLETMRSKGMGFDMGKARQAMFKGLDLVGQLQMARLLKKPGFRGPTPQKRLRNEAARAAKLARAA